MASATQPQPSFVQHVTAAFSQAAKALGQYSQSVVSGQQFKDNFFKDTGTFDQWFAHGAAEVANVIIHGHAAPMYTHVASPDTSIAPAQSIDVSAASPPDISPAGQVAAPTITPAANPETPQVQPPSRAEPSLIDQHLADIGVNASPEPAMQVPSPSVQAPDNPSLIDQHLAGIQQQSPEPQQREMEMQQ